MNSIQQLLSNTVFAFISNIIVKASNSVLFIFIGRLLGVSEAGSFNLAITYYAIMLGLSAWGLHELLVRDLTTRKEQSHHFLANYLILRVILAVATYTIVITILLLSAPYSSYSLSVIIILGVAVIPEAIFSIIQAFFEAHELLLPSALAAICISIIKLVGGIVLLIWGGSALTIAWLIPISSTIGLLVFIPFLLKLFKDLKLVGHFSLFNPHFSLDILRQTPIFFIMTVFSIFDYQADAFLISLFLTEKDLGWYGASQTALLAFWTLPVAIRAVSFPLLARLHKTNKERLKKVYEEIIRILIIFALPVAAGIGMIASPIILIIFGEGFEPAIPALQWSIWAFVFAIITVPSARLLIIDKRQKEAAWVTGASMILNITLNLFLIPSYGITGAAIARTLSSIVFSILIYWLAQRLVIKHSILFLIPRPILATLIMTFFLWQVSDFHPIISVSTGFLVYGIVILLLGGVKIEDINYAWKICSKK